MWVLDTSSWVKAQQHFLEEKVRRIKITRELSKHKSGHVVYMLDEPTTGLHFDDVKRLIKVLNRLVEKGNTVYVIEHNLDVVKNCDYLIDLGPEGGDSGGEVLATGTPEKVSDSLNSYTGKFMKKMLNNSRFDSQTQIGNCSHDSTI